MFQRTSVGLDVHALSVVACAVDGQTGEGWKQRLCPDAREILVWLRSLPGPVKVVYEAGPTGFGLCRSLNHAGTECVVVAPSKLQRPAGDRVKTDARDALHLARLLRLGEIVEVTVPSVEQEAARDLAHARGDARGDLMQYRLRLSKLLLRQGIVYSGGAAWTGARCVAPWSEVRPVGTAGDVRLELRGDAAHARPPRPTGCGDRGDGGEQSLHADGAPAGMFARDFDVDRVRVGGLDR